MAKKDMEVNISANINDLVKAINEAKKLIKSLTDSFSNGLKLAIDSKSLKRDINSAINELNSVGNKKNLIIDVDSSKLKSNIKSALRKAIDEINSEGLNKKLKLPTNQKMKVTVDTASARMSIKNLQDMLNKKDIRINTGKAESDIIRLSTYMNQLASKNVTLGVDVTKLAQAKLDITELSTYLNQLKSKDIKIRIDFENKDIVNNLKTIDDLLKSIQKNSNINLKMTGSGGGGGTKSNLQSQVQQYRTLRQEARQFALEAEKAWTAGDKKGFEQNRQNFLVAMKDLADFSRQLGNLSASREAGMYSNMLRSLQQTSPLYQDILNKVKQLKQEQKDLNNLISDGNKKLKQEGGSSSQRQQKVPGFMQGTVGASAYAIRFFGRSSKGVGSFGEAVSQFITDLNSLGGNFAKVAMPLAAVAGSIAVFSTALTVGVKGVEIFGNLLQQIGQEIYSALKPGIELYKQQTSAFFSFTASLMSNGLINGQKISEMPNGKDTAMGLSNKLLAQAQIDAEMSAFSLQDILASLQGTLPILMSHGMTAEQAYEINKGVAAVAKMIQLTPSQILQETRDLAQGSITSRGSQVANALGVTNADLKKFEGDAEGLYKFLMDKFKQYSELLQQFEDTALGRFQQLQERWQTVARNMIEGVLPQFKGLFEGIIEMTGQWVSTSGTYINQFGERVKTTGKITLDALTGEWKDELGNVLKDFKYDDKPFFEMSETFEKIKEALPEIVKYLASAIDEIIQFVEEETGISDPIELAKEGIKLLIDGFVTSVKMVVSLISSLEVVKDLIIGFEPILMPVVNIVRSIGAGFKYVSACIQVCVNDIEIAIAGIRRLWSAVWDEDSTYATKKWDEAIAKRQKSGEFANKAFNDWYNMESYQSFEEMFSSFKKRKNVKVTTLEDFVNKYAKGELSVKGTDRGLGDVKGQPKNTEDEKARKQAIKDAQKDMQEHIKGLKEALKDHIAELKETLAKNKIAFDEGFMSIREYYEQKAQIEAEEAQARLKEAQEEREWILKTPYENQADQLKALHTVNREIREYTRAVQKTTVAQKEVAQILSDYSKAFDEWGVAHDVLYGTQLGGGVGRPVDLSNISGMSNTEVAYRFLTSQGFSDAITRGIIASLKGESLANPKDVHVDSNGLLSGGIAQWNGERFEQLKQFAEENHSDWQDIRTQLAFLVKEIQKGGTQAEAFAKALQYYNEHGQTAEAMAEGWTIYLEVPADKYNKAKERAGYVADVDKDLIDASASKKQAQSTTVSTNAIYDAIEKALKEDNFLGQTLENGTVACVEAATKLGAYFSTTLAEAVEEGIVNTDVLDSFLNDKKVGWIDFDKTKLKPGDLIFFDGAQQNQHVMLYQGNGMVTGNSSSAKGGRGAVIQQSLDDYLQYSGLTPTHIRTTSQTSKWGSVYSPSQLVADTTETAAEVRKLLQDYHKKLRESSGNIEALQLGKYQTQVNNIWADYYDKLSSKEVQGLEGDAKDKYIQELLVQTQKKVSDLMISVFERSLNYNLDKIESDFEVITTKAQFGQIPIDKYYSILDKYTNYFFNTKGNGGGEDNGIWSVFKYLDEITKEAENYLKAGMSEAYQQAMNKIKAVRQRFYSMIDKLVEPINKVFDTAIDLFTSSKRFTPLQKEFGERELKAMQGQLQYNTYSDIEENLRSLKTSEIERYNNGLITSKQLESELLEIDKQLWDTTMAKEKAKMMAEDYPDYLRDLKSAARDALEDGLVTFLTDGITEAESLKDALYDLAKTVLKEIQKVSAKYIVKNLMNGLFGGWNVDKQETLHLKSSQGLDTQLTVAGNNVISALNEMAIGIRNSGLGQALGMNQNMTSTSGMTPTTQIGRFQGYWDRTANQNLGVFSSPWSSSPLNPNANKYSFGVNNQVANNQGTNNYSFDYASLGIQKLGESANIAGQQALPNFTQGIQNVSDNLANANVNTGAEQMATTMQTATATFEGALQLIVTYINGELTTALINLATMAGNAAIALSTIGGGAAPSGAATGGLIKGPGTSTSDDIPTMLSNGEYVIKASSVKKYGTNFLDALNNGNFSRIKSKLPHFANGGLLDIAQDQTARGVSNFGKNMASNINNTANISVALVRDEQEGMRELLKSAEGQKIMMDFSRKYAKFTSRL